MDLSSRYREYIECLNTKDLPALGHYVHENVRYNGERIGLDGYRRMISTNYEQIPDLRFNVEVLISQAPYVGAVLQFDCHPASEFLGLTFDGKRAVFNENVFYRFLDGKIEEVWSVIDKASLEKKFRPAVR